MKAIVLAGGKSSRMGENKALISLGDKLIIERAINVLTPLFDQVLVSGKKDDYQFLNHSVVEDVEIDKGPIGGIYSALEQCKEDLFVLSCDMPFISAELIKHVLEKSVEGKINILRYKNKVYPTLGIYPYHVIGYIKESINRNQLKMTQLVSSLKANYIACDNEHFESQLMNLNTRENLEKARSFYQL